MRLPPLNVYSKDHLGMGSGSYLLLEPVFMNIPKEGDQSIIQARQFSNWENKQFYTPRKNLPGRSMASAQSLHPPVSG
jgi:hypothetical protein